MWDHGGLYDAYVDKSFLMLRLSLDPYALAMTDTDACPTTLDSSHLHLYTAIEKQMDMF